MRWIESFLIVTAACFGAGCGRGVSTNPLARGDRDGDPARHSGGTSGGNTAATGGTESNTGGSIATTGGTTGGGGRDSGSGGPSTGGSSETGGSSTGGDSGAGGSDEPEGKPDGDGCSNDDECNSKQCTDGVCCNEACDHECERCNGLGTCAFFQADDACEAPNVCTDRGRCRLPDGETCGGPDECESENCALTESGATVCCDTPCDGVCEVCSAAGTCSAQPTDADCGPVTCDPDTRCVTYQPPAPNSCSGKRQCASCLPTFVRAGMPCDIGRQCDGAGRCELPGNGRVAAGERHTCAINDDANVVCWGDNRFGQLGAVFHLQRVGLDEMPMSVPQREIDFDDDVVQLAAGTQHTCALFATGGVRCWGSMWAHPTWGQLTTFLGTLDVTFVLGSQALAPPYGFIDPLQTGNVILAEEAEQISASPEGATICALLRSGNISCWGMNTSGQLGIGHREQLILAHLESLPIVDLEERVVEVRSGFANTCALTEIGRVHCWGDGLYGRLGNGENGPRYSPGDAVDIGESVVDLAVGFDHTCVVLERGAVRCWGNNHQGQLGYGHTDAVGDNETPAQAAMSERPENVALGGDVALGTKMIQVTMFPASSTRGANGIWDSSPTCALSEGRLVRCWGRNDVGQLGYGHDLPGAMEHTPVELEAIRISDRFVDVGGEVLALAGGGRCALRTTGEIYCWGANDHGQVGVPPKPFPSLTQTPFQMQPVHWWAER